jgi:hypothetical protein
MKKTLYSAVLVSILLSACGSPITPTQTDADKIRQYMRISENPGQTTVDPLHGKETGFWYGAILGSNGVNANGVGFIHKFEDGTLTATVNLNILKAPEKSYFVAWLTDEGQTKFIRVGVLESIVGDARHSVSFSTKDDVTGLTSVLVTLEAATEPKTPGNTKEATGTLREVQKTVQK